MRERCPDCGFEFDEELETCPSCGIELPDEDEELEEDDFDAFLDDLLDDEEEEEEDEEEEDDEDEEEDDEAVAASPQPVPEPAPEPEPEEEPEPEPEPEEEPEPEPDLRDPRESTTLSDEDIPVIGVEPVEEEPVAYPEYVLNETDPKVREQLEQGEQLVAAGHYLQACVCFERALEIRFDQRETMLRLAELARQNNDAQRLSRCYVSLFRISKENTERANFLVKAAVALPSDRGLADKAIQALDMALKLDPGNENAYQELLSHRRRTREWLPAAVLIQNRIQHFNAHPPDDPQVLAALWGDFALALNKAGRPADAKVALERQRQLLSKLNKG